MNLTKFIGIPYKHGGRLIEEGLDCFGLAKLILKECHSINLIDYYNNKTYPRKQRHDYLDDSFVHSKTFENPCLILYGMSPTCLLHIAYCYMDSSDYTWKTIQTTEQHKKSFVIPAKNSEAFLGFPYSIIYKHVGDKTITKSQDC